MEQHRKKMIFHSPIDIFQPGKSGDFVRPRCMYEAFRAIGYEVRLICGNSTARRRAFEELLTEDLTQYAFFYSELSSRSLYITDEDRRPRAFFLDFAFIRRIASKKIPVAFFYRDIHWRFRNDTVASRRLWSRPITYALHLIELYQIYRIATKIYIPSLLMGEAIPCPKNKFSALPPAGDEKEIKHIREEYLQRKTLKLFYVGGCTGSLYNLSEMLASVSKARNVELTICTRRSEWLKTNYELSSNVNVIFLQGDEMRREMRNHEISMMYYPPNPYRKFAIPVKLYESICEGIPVISDGHSYLSDIIRQENMGWIADSQENLTELLNTLSAQKGHVYDMALKTTESAKLNTWAVRARKVECELFISRAAQH